MRTHLAVAAVGLALVAADAPKKDAVKDELAKIQGTWRLESGEFNGQKYPDNLVKDVVRTITGDKYEVTRGGKQAGQGKMTLDPTKAPRTVDVEMSVTTPDGETKTDKRLGIYELDGDTMKTCLAEPGKERPKEFSAKKDGGTRLFVWKREKK
jgi:uncharacterized protein (TIGR03067 family)